MTINPLISIIIPVFNRVEYIEDAIISAVNQTYKNIEVIVVDNKSTDGTYEKILELNKNFKFKIHQNKKNYGRVENWNIGLHLAKGSFVQYLMSDDLLLEDCIKIKVELLNKYYEKNIVIVNSAFLKIPSNIVVSSYENEIFFEGKKAYYDVTIKGSWMNGPNDNMINLAIAKICGGFDIKLSWTADWNLFSSMMLHGNVIFTPQVLSVLRDNGSRYNTQGMISGIFEEYQTRIMTGFRLRDKDKFSVKRLIITRLNYLNWNLNIIKIVMLQKVNINKKIFSLYVLLISSGLGSVFYPALIIVRFSKKLIKFVYRFVR